MTLRQINLGKFKIDEQKTKEFRQDLSTITKEVNITGVVLKRKFPKEENETYYCEYIYSAWIYCEKNEIPGYYNYKLDLNSDPLYIDWLQNEEVLSKTHTVKISSTPIFLLVNHEKGEYSGVSISGFVIFIEIFGLVLIIGLIAINVILFHKKFIQKKEIDSNKNLFASLLH